MTRAVLEPGKPLSAEQTEAGVAGIDWDAWTPTVRATLGFVLQSERLLLIRKQRGLGAGKLTGPGGKLDPGESAEACALRELQEELGISMRDARRAGEFSAQFLDGLAMHVTVFVCNEFKGELRETEEAIPHWVPLDAIPYQEMWPDNALWLPHLIAGREFRVLFVLNHQRLFDWRVTLPS